MSTEKAPRKPLLVSPRFIVHPAATALRLPPEEGSRDASDEAIEASSFIVVDGRQDLPESLVEKGSAAARAMSTGKGVLLLEPSLAHLEAWGAVVNGLPLHPVSALFARRESPHGFIVEALGHPLVGLPAEELSASSQAGDREGNAANHRACGPCRGERGERAGSSTLATRDFADRVRKQLRARARDAVATTTPPTGMKYFQTTYTSSHSFTYNSPDYTQPSSGSLNLTWVTWGFLNQSSSASNQILIIESTYQLNPGTLLGNDDEERGFLNINLNASIDPDLSTLQYQPTTGSDSWSGTLSVPINYAIPTGGYGTWTFETTVNNSISDWSVQNISSGSSLGSEWYVNDPLDGTGFPDNWSDAFDFDGHVDSFPSASTGTLTVDAASAWQTSGLVTGSIYVPATLNWYGAHFYGTSCGLLFCYKINCGYIQESWSPSHSFDFSSLQPS